MLVLSRKENQSIRLTVKPSETPTEIILVVVNERDERGYVRLGFEAPQSVHILRTELIPAGSESTIATDGGPDSQGENDD